MQSFGVSFCKTSIFVSRDIKDKYPKPKFKCPAFFLVGGRDDTTELSSAEKYEAKTNTWTPVVALNSRRSGVGLAVVNGLLIAVCA